MNSRTISLILIMLIASCYTFWVKPQLETLRAKEQTLANIQEQIEVITGKEQLAINETTDFSELDQKLLEEAVPQGLDQDSLIKLIKRTADDYQVNITSIGFTQSIAETTNQIKAIQISLNSNGNPSNVKAFLAALENLNRGFFVQNISVSFGSINEVDISNLSINFEAYFS